ncbi:hypothetical protein C8J56DRAFT_901526 [Mycena floridula]|nr:hypothetical protein C8J56DRAFT_901526 [Mycena floridula]
MFNLNSVAHHSECVSRYHGYCSARLSPEGEGTEDAWALVRALIQRPIVRLLAGNQHLDAAREQLDARKQRFDSPTRTAGEVSFANQKDRLGLVDLPHGVSGDEGSQSLIPGKTEGEGVEKGLFGSCSDEEGFQKKRGGQTAMLGSSMCVPHVHLLEDKKEANIAMKI